MGSIIFLLLKVIIGYVFFYSTLKLFFASGGTEFEHCATIARSDSIWGPFESCPANPILHAPSRNALFQTVGHADIFLDQNSQGGRQWWLVCLASRVVNGSYPIGRESVLMKVDWRGEWPVVDLSALDIDPATIHASVPSSSSPTEWDDLLSEPHHRILHLRNPNPSAYSYLSAGSTSTAVLHPTNIRLDAPLGSPTMISVRQKDLYFECEATFSGLLELATEPETLEFGLMLYNDHEHHLKAAAFPRQCRISFNRIHPSSSVPAETQSIYIQENGVELSGNDDTLILRVSGSPTEYRFEAGFIQEEGHIIWKNVGTGMTSDMNGGFAGAVIAIYAVAPGGEGLSGGTTIHIRDWMYRTLG
jgi:hypothetical protein